MEGRGKIPFMIGIIILYSLNGKGGFDKCLSANINYICLSCCSIVSTKVSRFSPGARYSALNIIPGITGCLIKSNVHH